MEKLGNITLYNADCMEIAKKDAELAKLKQQNAKNTAKLNAMSDAELSSTFTELFN